MLLKLDISYSTSRLLCKILILSIVCCNEFHIMLSLDKDYIITGHYIISAPNEIVVAFHDAMLTFMLQ